MVFGLFSKKKKLLKAIENGELDEVSSLLEGFNELNETFSKPDSEDVENWTYLLHACKFGNSGLVELLLKSGADLDVTDSDGKPPLYWASCNGDNDETTRICTLLIEKGVDINQQATTGRTALMWAALKGNSGLVELLLKSGADLDVADNDGDSSILYATINDDDDDTARICALLIEKGVDINQQSTEGEGALYRAAGKDNYKTLKVLLEAGANRNLQTDDGLSALMYAANQDNNKSLEVLLEAGADPNLQEGRGVSALYLAASKSAEAVKILLEHKADPNIETMHKTTPIFEAADARNIEIMSVLIEGGADINHESETPDGELYPLDVAVGSGIDSDDHAAASYLLLQNAKYNPDFTDVEVMVHANEEQASFHEGLGEEGKYHYELHMKDLNSEQIEHMKSEFEQYTWDMGFAVTDFEFKQDGDIFKILFDSKKYFDMEKEDWDDQDLAQNIVTRILGKEQFICSTLWGLDLNFEEKNIVFIDDKQNEWAVEVGKHGDLSKIS